jgi:transposase
MSKYPEWVLSQKTKGTELRLLKGCYYLYQVSSHWDSTKKRPVKKTGILLGRITPDGLKVSQRRTEPSKNLVQNNILAQNDDNIKPLIVPEHIIIKEYGCSWYFQETHSDLLKSLQPYFGNYAESLFILAIFRVLHQSPLKNMLFHYQHSFLSEFYPKVSLNDKTLTQLLREIGSNRQKIIEWLKSQAQGCELILIDATDMVNFSKQTPLAKVGYNSHGHHDPQANLMFIFSADHQMPVYYRLLAGNIREVSAMKLTIQESGLKQSILVADKGFFSLKNINTLQEANLSFILPLRRDNKLIDYKRLEKHGKERFDGYFRFKHRTIWYYQQPINDTISTHKVILFFDESLCIQERNDFLTRIEDKTKKDTLDDFYAKQHVFGTITLLSNLDENKSAQDIFTYYKTRNEIEVLFDTFKNLIHADRSYMHGSDQLEAWMLINYLSLILYYKMYQTLVSKNLIKKYCPKDVFMLLNEVKKLKIDKNWHLAEINTKVKTAINKILKPIT